MEDRNDLNLGYEQKQILSCFLQIHDENLSSRQLRRILARRGLTRRKNVFNLSTVVNRIERELQCSGRNIRYRSMWQRLVVDHDLVDTKNTVRHTLRFLDPEGVHERFRHRLQRGEYKARGPNFLWHIDGLDKLKPSGFAYRGGNRWLQ